jgi:hypothetical protein
MFKLVIWMNLNAQSVCTCQIWIFLILWCSTWWEDSKDYKFVIFGHLKQKIWFKQVNGEVWLNLKMISIWLLKLCTISALLDSTHSKDSNDILFAIFRVTDQKIWFIKVLDQIWFQILIRICFKSREGHVACSYWCIPVRADRWCGASDLSQIWWTRLIDTLSLKWSVRVTGSRSNGHD